MVDAADVGLSIGVQLAEACEIAIVKQLEAASFIASTSSAYGGVHEKW